MSEELEKAWDVVVRLRNDIALAKEELVDAEHHVGELMTGKTAQLADGTLIHRSKTLKTEWSDYELFEALMDARYVDPKTGEIIEETPTAKILAVYGSRPRGEPDADPRLPGRLATKGELTKRGLDPEAFCTKTFSDFYSVREVRA